MAPIPNSSYFPSLERCLNGDLLVVNIEIGTDHRAVIERFLSDPEVVQLLARPFDAYPPPSTQSKATFETKTSAINVTPSSSAKYDIKEIKEDSLWLSKVAKLDEVSALRLVTEECQFRTSAQLLAQFSEEELASIRDAAGNSQYSSSIPLSLLVQGLDPEAIQQQFARKDRRRQRILRTYFSERRYLLKTSERLLDAVFLHQAKEQNAADKGKGKGKAVELERSWQTNCGIAIASQQDMANPQSFILRCIRAIGATLKKLEERSGWSDLDGEREDIEIEWIRSQFTEATHAMELLWQFIVNAMGIPTGRAILEWFRLQQSYGFFNSFESDEPSIQASFHQFRSITTIVSLGMLNLPSTLDQVAEPTSTEDVSSEASIDEAFLLNPRTVTEVQEIFLQAADTGFETVGPALLAWGLILRELNIRVERKKAANQIDAESYNPRSSSDSEIAMVPDPYEQTLEEIKGVLDEDPIDFLARRAVNTCRVFQTIATLSLRLGNTSTGLFSNSVSAKMRMYLLDLIKNSTIVGYIPEIIEATLATLTGNESYWDILDSKPIDVENDPVAMFLTDDVLVNGLLKNSQFRYPWEALPFLQMIRALASCSSCYGNENSKSALIFLESIPMFTYTMPADFDGYETVQEEENANNIRLTQPVMLFEPRLKGFRNFGGQNRLLAVARVDEDFCISVGTHGRIISESGPKVAFWYHQYHGLKYFGKLLETFLAASAEVDATTHQPVDRDSVSEIIGIIATLLLSIARSAHDNPNSIEDARKILEIASSGLNRNRDVISVIFDIFEEELQNLSACSGSDVPLQILVSCIHFIHAMIPISPGRVWPLMSRTALLAVSRGKGKLPSIVESVELLSGRYEFLISCCRLYESLVEDFASNAMRRRSKARSSARLNDGDEDISTGIPDLALAKILLSFTRYLVDVLESSPGWKYAEQGDRQRICEIISRTYNKVLEYAYGIETSIDTKEEEPPTKINRLLKSAESPKKKENLTKIMEPLMPSALLLIESFLSASSGTLRFQPLLRSYYDGLETPDMAILPNLLNLWTAQVNAVLSFSKTLLRVSAMLGRPPSQLENQLFKVSSLIARLYVVNDTYRTSVVTLFESLIVTASNNTSEPPSLLGHLGPQTAKNFLHVLSDLDKPLSRDENVRSIWDFLSKVVSSRQQWFANYLLTGKTPREALTAKTSGKELASLDKPLLTTALEALTGINELAKTEALPMLQFVTLAQNFWPWTVCNSPKYGDFIKAISNFVGHFKPIQQSTNLEVVIDACHQTRIGAYVAEILAMHLFHARQTGIPTSMPELLPNLSYFTRFAVGIPNYNNSLHALLKQNFETKYPGCTLRDLKRTTLEEHQYGKGYFYNLQLANKMLSMSEAWTGRSDNGLRAELANANVNLSLVDAHIALFHSWRYLSIELSGNAGNQDLQKLLTKVVADCLTANMRPQPPEEIFSRLLQTRVDFGIVLTQRLIQANSTVPEMQGLLGTAWDAIRALRGSFDRAVLDADILYYRSLLKLLFLTIRIHAEAKQQDMARNLRASKRIAQTSSIGPVIMEIVNNVVAIGIREIASVIHESPADSSPEDFALITGILQSCLRIPGIELCQPQIVNMLTQASVPRLVVTLFSWSDSLAIDGDPIYGELSMLFLLELSSMPLMAEQLAIDGVLGHLASANITSYLRSGKVGPFAESAGLQRCYSIWARGILPFLLNLLDAVQASIATEVSLFLAQFSNLVKQSEQSLDAPETNRIIPQGTVRYITLTICSETHSMALVTFILNGLRETLKGTTDIPDVKWDASGVLENVEFWLSSRALLKDRLLPMGEREMEMRRKGGPAVSELEKKVLSELEGIKEVLNGGENGS